MMAFLEVVTRTFAGRPGMLERNQDSLRALSDPDWTQRLVIDEVGRGVEWAVRNLTTVEATGEYVWVLDDDDYCVDKGLVGELKRVAEASLCPDVIMVRCYHAKYGMLPSTGNWRREPVRGNVGTSCYIVRGEVWNATRAAWQERYDGDYWYIKHLWDAKPGFSFAWLETLAAFYPQQSLGAVEGVDAR